MLDFLCFMVYSLMLIVLGFLLGFGVRRSRQTWNIHNEVNAILDEIEF